MQTSCRDLLTKQILLNYRVIKRKKKWLGQLQNQMASIEYVAGAR
jgi:hypothetical protein